VAEIELVIAAFALAAGRAKAAGFDGVQIHAAHGYLVSQFLSPYTNRRRDLWGGPFANRARFLRLVMKEVKKAAAGNMAVLVKINMEDGFTKGMPMSEGLEVARILEGEGADALVLSGGFVSKTPFFMMKGKTPHAELIRRQRSLLIKAGMFLFSRIIVRDYTYSGAYFLEDALKFREAVKIPLVYVGGLISRPLIDEVLSRGFDFVAMARAFVAEPDFVNRISKDPSHVSKCLACGPCNLCVAAMYGGEVECLYNG